VLAIIGVYVFILVGFLAKKFFKEIEAKTLVILSTYFFQPFLVLWGIMLVPLNKDLILSPIFYFIAIFVSLIFTYFTARILEDKKERIIASITALIANTGNIGVPVCYALFGDVGASVATLINLANMFFVYSFGIFFFAKGEYSFKNAIIKVAKIPIMWFGILALVLNYFHVTFPKEVMKILQMGAFASIVTQLVIFGIYIAEVKIREISLKLGVITMVNKFIIFPLVTFLVVKIAGLKPPFSKIVLLESLSPLAVTNVNLASLFNLYPRKVAFLIIVSSILYIFIFFLI